MRALFLLFIATWVVGCETWGARKTVSGWHVLEKTSPAKCANWPQRSKDLQVDDLRWIRGAGFVTTGLRRDAAVQQTFVPFTGSRELDADTVTTLTLGGAAIVTGGVIAESVPVVLVIHNGLETSTIEVRTVRDNIVKFKTTLGAYNVVEGWLVEAVGSAWIVYRSEANDYYVAHFDLRSLAKISGKVVAGAKYKEQPTLVVAPGKTAATVLWKEDAGKQPFMAQTIAENGQVSIPAALPVDIANQVESWAAYADGGGVYVATIDGDTLIGRAELRISYLNWADGAPKARWSKASPLVDVHTTEPLFTTTERGLEVMVLNWIDEESTIARYNVAAGNIGKPTFSGIFPKGTRIVDALRSGDDQFVVTRNRNDNGWLFRVCEL